MSPVHGATLTAILLSISLFSGCLGGPEPLEAASAPAEEMGASLPVVITVDESGTTGTGAAACTPLGGCVGQMVTGEERVFSPSLTGTLVGVDLVAEWVSTSPETEELLLGVSYKDGDEWAYIYEVGPSPLRLSKSGLDIAAKDFTAFYVNAFKCTPTPVAACASSDVAFTVKGTLDTRAE